MLRANLLLRLLRLLKLQRVLLSVPSAAWALEGTRTKLQRGKSGGLGGGAACAVLNLGNSIDRRPSRRCAARTRP